MSDGQSAGPAVDRAGSPVIDPTENVKALVYAEQKRQDDLRHETHDHMEQIAKLRADYEEKLRLKESERIDALRALGDAQVARAAEVQDQRANVLAAQVQFTADTLRGQVEAAKIAAADSLSTALAPITKAIEDLRAAQYAAQGEKGARIDPAVDELRRAVSALERTQSTTSGEKTQQREGTQNNQWLIGVVIGVAVFAADFLAKKL